MMEKVKLRPESQWRDVWPGLSWHYQHVLAEIEAGGPTPHETKRWPDEDQVYVLAAEKAGRAMNDRVGSRHRTCTSTEPEPELPPDPEPEPTPEPG